MQVSTLHQNCRGVGLWHHVQMLYWSVRGMLDHTYSTGQKFYVTFESLELVNNSVIQNIATCKEWLCSSHIFTISRLRYLLLILLVALLILVALCKYHLSVLDATILSVRERCEKRQSGWGAVDNGRPYHGLSSTKPFSIPSLLITYMYLAQRQTYIFLAIGQRP